MLSVHITSPSETTDHAEVRALRIPAAHGVWYVLPGHAEAFTTLAKGPVVVKYADGQEETLSIEGGECHVANDVVTVIL